jgi:hypothetical protein
MTHFPQPHSGRRATRVQLATTIPTLVKMGDGKLAQAKLQSISVTGGLLQLAKSLGRGDLVEVEFQMRSEDVEGMAEMLNPVGRGPKGTLQPFRFIALADDDHRALRELIDSASDRSPDGIWPKQ